MTATQYTVRGLPLHLDKALRRLAYERRQSLNAIVIEVLAKGLNISAAPEVYTDLDDLIGSWQEDPAFDAAMVQFGTIDEEAWK